VIIAPFVAWGRRGSLPLFFWSGGVRVFPATNQIGRQCRQSAAGTRASLPIMRTGMVNGL